MTCKNEWKLEKNINVMIYKKTITVLLLVLLLTVNLMSQNEPDSIYVDTIQLKKLVTEHKKYKDLDSLNTELLIIKNRRLYQQELKIEKLYSISEIDSLMINNYKEQLTLKDK